jgi:hypothetical protein
MGLFPGGISKTHQIPEVLRRTVDAKEGTVGVSLAKGNILVLMRKR